MKRIPEIKRENGIPTLFAREQPFLAFAGEVHNSSASSLAFMEERVWPAIEGMNLNTLIVPLYWELVEPEEGKFDFRLLEGLTAQAQSRDMHLILLWFGLWKNSESMYVPNWMKLDSNKYFRVKKANGEKIDTISPFCSAAIEKDARAFSRVMARLREIDEDHSTVIAIQVENEIGVLGTERDYCEAAQCAFAEEIPDTMAAKFRVKGNWKAAFGTDAEEYFMAYYFAQAVETITREGRKEYPLPCYANAWLKQHPWYPGSYPSGGPVKGVHRIWKYMAPSLFTLAPDIYVPSAAAVMEEYHYENNPLLIPEARKDAVTASYCLYAFTRHHAVCYSPFGIEDLGLPADQVMKPSKEVMKELNINPIMFETDGGKEYLSKVYDVMEQMKPLYFKYRGTGHMQSYLKCSETDLGTYFRFDEYDILTDYFPSMPGIPISAGVIYELDQNKFLMVGMMSRMTFRVKPGENRKVRALKLEDGELVQGEWKPGHIQNGDEQMQFHFGPSPSWLYVELYKY